MRSRLELQPERGARGALRALPAPSWGSPRGRSPFRSAGGFCLVPKGQKPQALGSILILQRKCSVPRVSTAEKPRPRAGPDSSHLPRARPCRVLAPHRGPPTARRSRQRRGCFARALGRRAALRPRARSTGARPRAVGARLQIQAAADRWAVGPARPGAGSALALRGALGCPEGATAHRQAIDARSVGASIDPVGLGHTPYAEFRPVRARRPNGDRWSAT